MNLLWILLWSCTICHIWKGLERKWQELGKTSLLSQRVTVRGWPSCWRFINKSYFFFNAKSLCIKFIWNHQHTQYLNSNEFKFQQKQLDGEEIYNLDNFEGNVSFSTCFYLNIILTSTFRRKMQFTKQAVWKITVMFIYWIPWLTNQHKVFHRNV